MARQEMGNTLLREMEDSVRVGVDDIPFPESPVPRGVPEGAREDAGRRTLFYCPGCSRSFWAFGREDRECFVRWHYRCWSAPCPHCGQETLQNDQYWR